VTGGTFSASRFSDVAQQGFVVQQGDAHTFWFGALSTTQVGDAEPSAKSIAVTSVSETAILLNISRFLTRLRLSVEAIVRFLGQKTTNDQL